MTIRNLSRLFTLLLPCAGAVAACSLTVPAEDELFGGEAGADAGGGGNGGKGGSEAQAGSNVGGSTPTAGSGTSGAAMGGTDNVGGSPGAGGQAAGEGGSENLPPGDAGSGAGGEPGGVTLPPAELLLHYTFDDLGTAQRAEDISGNELHGELIGNPLPLDEVAGHIGNAIRLDAVSQQHVQMPADILVDRPAVSVTSWLNLTKLVIWARLFDFNTDSVNFFYFSPTGWNPTLMAAGARSALLTASSGLAPEVIFDQIVPLNTWHHVAIVLAKPYLRYYLDGELKAEVTGLAFGADALGPTDRNWIGRSAHATDPYLTALVDDFRVYTGALTAEEIAELAAQ